MIENLFINVIGMLKLSCFLNILKPILYFMVDHKNFVSGTFFRNINSN